MISLTTALEKVKVKSCLFMLFIGTIDDIDI